MTSNRTSTLISSVQTGDISARKSAHKLFKPLLDRMVNFEFRTFSCMKDSIRAEADRLLDECIDHITVQEGVKYSKHILAYVRAGLARFTVGRAKIDALALEQEKIMQDAQASALKDAVEWLEQVEYVLDLGAEIRRIKEHEAAVINTAGFDEQVRYILGHYNYNVEAVKAALK